MTNRDKFNQLVKLEMENKFRELQTLSNEDLARLSDGFTVHIDRLLVDMKMNAEQSLSVGTIDDVIKWLGEEV